MSASKLLKLRPYSSKDDELGLRWAPVHPYICSALL
jgi:hypothetical protein